MALSKGNVIDKNFYADASAGKEPARAGDLESWLSANTFECKSFRARISTQQCEANRGRGMFLCGQCKQALPVAGSMKRRGRPRKTAEKVGGGVVESYAAQEAFEKQEREFHAARRIGRLLRDPVVIEVLRRMTKKGNRQAAGILAERGIA